MTRGHTDTSFRLTENTDGSQVANLASLYAFGVLRLSGMSGDCWLLTETPDDLCIEARIMPQVVRPQRTFDENLVTFNDVINNPADCCSTLGSRTIGRRKNLPTITVHDQRLPRHGFDLFINEKSDNSRVRDQLFSVLDQRAPHATSRLSSVTIICRHSTAFHPKFQYLSTDKQRELYATTFKPYVDFRLTTKYCQT